MGNQYVSDTIRIQRVKPDIDLEEKSSSENVVFQLSHRESSSSVVECLTGMRKFRIDQYFLIEHWPKSYIMPVVFAEIYF